MTVWFNEANEAIRDVNKHLRCILQILLFAAMTANNI